MELICFTGVIVTNIEFSLNSMEIGYDAVYSCSPSSRHTSFYFIKIFELIFINVKSFTQICTIHVLSRLGEHNSISYSGMLPHKNKVDDIIMFSMVLI